jgi:hypothetical protein
LRLVGAWLADESGALARRERKSRQQQPLRISLPTKCHTGTGGDETVLDRRR